MTVATKEFDLAGALKKLEARAASLPETLYRCAECLDCGFVLRRDHLGREWGRRCTSCAYWTAPGINPTRDAVDRMVVEGGEGVPDDDLPF